MVKINKFDFLVALYIFCISVAEMMGSKTFPLFRIGTYQLNASVAIFVIPLLFTVNDIIIEVHGKERAKSVVMSGLMMIFFIMMFSLLATSLPPSARFMTTENAYDKIFQASARISAASLTAFAIAEFLDIFIFSKLREMMKKKALWLRNNLSNFIAQFADTVIFMTLAFYAFDKSPQYNAVFLFSLILPYWLLKCGMSIIETPLVYIGVRWLKGSKEKDV